MFLKEYKLWLERENTPNTVKAYLHTVKAYIKFMEANDMIMDKWSAWKFISTLKKERSVWRHIYAIKSYFRFFRRGRDVAYLDSPKPLGKPTKPVLKSHIIRMIKAGKNIREKALMAVMYAGGLKPSEVAFLRKIDYNSKSKTIKISCKNKYETIPLDSETCKLLDEYLNTTKDDTILLFPGKSKGKITNEGIGKILLRACKVAGVRPINARLLRYTREVELMKKNLNHIYIQKFLRRIVKYPYTFEITVEDLCQKIPPAFRKGELEAETAN